MKQATIFVKERNKFTIEENLKYKKLAEGPGVARGKKILKKKKNLDFFLAFITPRPPMIVHKKISAQSVQPFGRL